MRTANSYLLSTPRQQSPLTSTSTLSVWCTRKFSSTALEPFSPQVVGSFSPFEFAAPVYNQVHQEQIVTGEMTLNMVEHPAVQEQETVQEIPQVSAVERIQELYSPV